MILFGEQVMNSYNNKGPKQKARIVNIQRYSLNDGGGIRTVIFFKGCPLKCPWCSNPESRSMQIEQAQKPRMYNNMAAEAMGGIKGEYKLTQYGWDVELNQLMDEILKDDVFFRSSKGGITLSGGEVLMQADFAIKLLEELKALAIHTTIETTGHGKKEDFKNLCALSDEILFDFKIMDKNRAYEILSAHRDLILHNFEYALTSPAKVIARIPLIPEYTMNKANMREIQQYLSQQKQKFEKLKEIHLLPFHQFGASKYENLGLDYELKSLKPPKDEKIELIKKQFEDLGFNVLVGG